MSALATSVYSAFRGYSWSRIPDGLTERLLDRLRTLAAKERGEFPDPEAVDRGVVAIGPVAAAFSIRSVPGWDSSGRTSEYSAFAFFRSADAAAYDFGLLLRHPFFGVPSGHDTPETIFYEGAAATVSPLTAAGELVCRRRLAALPASQGGDILSKLFTRSNEWIFRSNPDDTLVVTCSEWTRRTESPA